MRSRIVVAFSAVTVVLIMLCVPWFGLSQNAAAYVNDYHSFGNGSYSYIYIKGDGWLWDEVTLFYVSTNSAYTYANFDGVNKVNTKASFWVTRDNIESINRWENNGLEGVSVTASLKRPDTSVAGSYNFIFTDGSWWYRESNTCLFTIGANEVGGTWSMVFSWHVWGNVAGGTRQDYYWTSSSTFNYVGVPKPPTNLQGSPGDGSATLSWTTPSYNGGSSITGYAIYYGTSSGSTISDYPYAFSVGVQNSYTGGGLTNGITYYFRIGAINVKGLSQLSNEVSVTPIYTNTAPSCTITSPTSSSTYSTSSSTISLGGSSSDDISVTSVTWSNAATGGSGTASGTTSWSISSISLNSGSNTITVTAHDGGGLTGSDTITVTYTPDSPPTISITSPTSSSTYSTSSSTINLGGSASDDHGVNSVTWSNAATGGSGTASGTTSWSKTGISLQSGTNVITVTAHDTTAQTATDTITVTYTPPPGALLVTGTASTTSGQEPLTVSFTCTPSGGTSPYTYSWTFGDGGSSSQQNPGHTYSSAGTFTATVTVTDSASHTGQWSTTITVTGGSNGNDGGSSGSGGISSSTGAIIGLLVVMAIAALLLIFFLLKRRKKDD